MANEPLKISQRTRRRYLLGEQGLWPGRRWQGKSGILQAVGQIEAVQIDPVAVIAPSQDLVLWGRVHDYRASHLDSLLYSDRLLFDYGSHLNIYPAEELPFWKHIMQRRAHDQRWVEFAQTHSDVISKVLSEVEARGPLRKRDLQGKRVENYRGSKDSGVALHYLWLTGRLMSHSRVGRERVYDLTERIAPELAGTSVVQEKALEYLMWKQIRQLGLISPRKFRLLFNRVWDVKLTLDQARGELEGFQNAGKLVPVVLEELGKELYLPAERLDRLHTVQQGQIPPEWHPVTNTTRNEVIFLSPLEYLSARGRAKEIFDFEYIWEIYKRPADRVYGPYTLPILFEDRLVGRLDGKSDRSRGQFIVNGLWFEPWCTPSARFKRAFSTGLINLCRFLEMDRVDAGGISDPVQKTYFG